LVGFDGVVEDFLQGVLAAKFEEKDGEAGLFGEADVFKVGSAELRVVTGLAGWCCGPCPRGPVPRKL